MQISSKPLLSTVKKPIASSVSKGIELLSFYQSPPEEELSLDEFESYALDRLHLLRRIDNLSQQNNLDDNEGPGDIKTKLNKKIEEFENKFFDMEKDTGKRKRKDIASHFILRLAYCRRDDLRRWFINTEKSLFKSRLERDETYCEQFMKRNTITFELVTREDKEFNRDNLIGLCDVTENNFYMTDFFKIPFVDALTLVGRREVYLGDGYAWVPSRKVVSILVAQFRTKLSRALIEANKMLDLIKDDTRIEPLLKNMDKQFLGRDVNKLQDMDKLTPEKVDLAAEINMPLCAKWMHRHLKQEHKLKHWARQQYGLFLKAAGMSLEDSLKFWETHFMKAMNHDQFIKGYSYNIRHMYGKEGNRKNYTAPSCQKIILGPQPEHGAYHGCPYKHLSDNQLSSLLNSLKLGTEHTKEILSYAKNGHFQVACSKHFAATHPGFESMTTLKTEDLATHPNYWYRTSVDYYKIKNNVSGTSQNTPASLTPISQQNQLTPNIQSQSQSHTQDELMVNRIKSETLLMMSTPQVSNHDTTTLMDTSEKVHVGGGGGGGGFLPDSQESTIMTIAHMNENESMAVESAKRLREWSHEDV